MVNKVLLNCSHKIDVQYPVDTKVYGLLAAIPNIIDMDICFGYLKTGGYPDAVDRDIDGGNQDSNAGADLIAFGAVHEEDHYAVNDYLKEELDLESSLSD